jgi:hypothetical protein
MEEVQQIVFIAYRHPNMTANKLAVLDEIQSYDDEMANTGKSHIQFFISNQYEAKLARHLLISM